MVLVAILLFSIQIQVLVISKKLTCNHNDLRGLSGFINGLESQIDQSSWPAISSLSCCNWEGITCDPSTGRIVRLQLPIKRLTGNLSDSISSLDMLTTLNLSHNSLKGPLPVSLLQLPLLEVLDLSGNNFNGVLPVSINLPALQVLDISDNSFQGSLPSGLCVNSTEIRDLRLAANYFTGVIPRGLRKCRFLERLSMASNLLTGVIPEFLLLLLRLQELSLQDNMFISIAETVNSSSQLVHLDVSSNMLSRNLPDFFHCFPSLRFVSAHSNNFSGRVPLSLSNSRTISSINLRNNSLDGSVDFNCSKMVNLASLDLGTNNFSGTLPANLASCHKLKAFNVAKNKLLGGEIPESFKDFKSLSYLSLSNCSFSDLSAFLKILQHCKNLTVLILTMNFYDEHLPSDADFQFKSLKALVIANCRLTGSIPSWLNSLTRLQLLDLSFNRLTGSIPAYFGNFNYLFYLDLSNNSLSGEIPKTLTQLQSLTSRNESFEEPSIDFPFLRFKYKISSIGITLLYIQIQRFPPRLDLSRNPLTGSISSEFGNLKRLHVLDLKHNNLSGSIPNTLSEMRNMETLDLSYNSLTGKIPPSLVKLSFLSKFSVAYNNLTGIIPSGGQFSTFSNSSFEGNKGLCGELFVKCQKNQDLLQDSTSKDDEYDTLRLLVLIGFGIGFFVSVITLLVIPIFWGTSS